MPFPDSIKQRGYVQAETTWGTIPNTTGVATLSADDAFLFTDLTINDNAETAERPDKTGSFSRVVGIKTRRNGTFTVRGSLPGVSTAGSAPDIAPMIESAMGKVGTVHPSTDVQYDLEDANPSFCLWDFNGLATATQRVAMGCIASRMRIAFGQNFGDFEFSGECKGVLDSDQFPTASATLKSGLTAWPANEPANPVVTGNAVTGYKGTITLDGNAYTTVRSGELEVVVDRELQKQAWGEDLPTGPMGGGRRVNVTLTLDDDDSANLKSLKIHAYDGGTVQFVLSIGNAAANIVEATIKNILLPHPTYDYSQKRRGIVFSTVPGAATNLTAKDELSFKWK